MEDSNATQNTTRTRVHVGDQGDVVVSADPDNLRYLINLPNAYDVYWPFVSRDEHHALAHRLDQPDIKRILFEVPLDNLSNEQQIQRLNLKVMDARKAAMDIANERQALEEDLSFDLAQPGKTVAFVYKTPAKGFATGDVVRAGKYFVALLSGETEDKVFVRVLHSTKLLNGKQEFAHREEVLKERFAIGSRKHLRYDERGRITVSDSQSKSVDKTQQEPNSDQAAALTAFRLKHGRDWKDELNLAWSTGQYKGMNSDQAALLQQVRNQLGPQWLNAYQPVAAHQAQSHGMGQRR